MLVNLTYDTWFGRSAAPYQHHLIAIFRAIENRRFLVRSTYTGYTAVVNPLGKTIADAFLNMYVFESACKIQVRAQAGGGELIPIPAAIIAGAQQQAKAVTKSLGGMLAWPGLLRRLERKDPSYRT